MSVCVKPRVCLMLFAVAVVVACQPRPLGPGDEVPISGRAYFVVPAGWVGTHQTFGDDRRCDFQIRRGKTPVGAGEFQFRREELGPAFSALAKVAAGARLRTAERGSSATAGEITVRLATFCYLQDPYDDPVYHKPVVPPWSFLGSAGTTYDGQLITIRARYDIPADVVSRDAATVPEAVRAAYERDFVRTVTTALRFRPRGVRGE